MCRLLLLLPVLLLASCAADKSREAAPAHERKSLTEQLSTTKAIKQNAKGEWPDDMKKASSFENNRKSGYFTEKSGIAKPYKTGEYTKTAWGGKKEVSRQSYTGNTGASSLPKASRLQGLGAREASTAAKTPGSYETGDYKTSAAREGSAKDLDKPSDAETDVRRRVFPEPEISSWKQQRALDVTTTKSILGRD